MQHMTYTLSDAGRIHIMQKQLMINLHKPVFCLTAQFTVAYISLMCMDNLSLNLHYG